MTFVGAGEQPEVLCLSLKVLLPDFLDLNQVEDSFHQLPEVDVHLFRGLTLEGKATQVVWAWGYRRVDEDPARRLRTPAGTDFTVARVCLVIWANLAALPGHFLGVMAGVLSGAGHPLAVLVAVLTGAQDAGQGSEGAEGWVPHLPVGVRLPTMHAGFLMFLLQDNFDCRAAFSLRSEVARDEAQRGDEPTGGWGAQASSSPVVP